MQKTSLAAILILLCADARLAHAGYDDPMKFTYQSTAWGNCPECEWILAEGVIGSETDKDFIRALQQNKLENMGLIIQFNSPGGDLQAAIRLGRFLRQGGWRTEVGYHYLPGTRPQEMSPEEYLSHKGPKLRPSKCMSACVYAFLGGIQRDVLEGAELAVHQFSDPKNSSSTAQLLQGALTQYVAEMGVQPTLVYLAAASTPAEAPRLHVLNRGEMESWNVVTSYRQVKEWAIVAKRSGIIAEVHGTGRMKSSLAIFCKMGGPSYLSYIWRPPLYGPETPTDAATVADFGRHAFSVNIKAGTNRVIAAYKHLDKYVKVANNGQVSLTVPLQEKHIEEIKATDKLSIEWDVPRYLHGMAELDNFAMKKARENITAAMRNCVRE